jgi:hypothetical protein
MDSFERNFCINCSLKHSSLFRSDKYSLIRKSYYIFDKYFFNI